MGIGSSGALAAATPFGLGERDRGMAGRFRCSGTHLGEFLDEAPTGKRMEVEEVFFLRAEGGRFVDFWVLEDSLGRIWQLGLLSSGTRTS
jgi:predicted ester cyclase